MSLMKALIPSTILTLLVAVVVGTLGTGATHQGFLALESVRIGGYSLFWSWPFFMTVMAINCLLVAHIAKRAGA